MMVSVRNLLGLLVLLLSLGLVGYLVFGGKGVEGFSSLDWTSSQQCASCHQEIFDQWKGSLHAKAWTDPFARKLSNNFANADCVACHAPRPVFEVGVGERVLPRFSRRVEGVDCIACHVTPRGVAGPSSNQPAACQPIQTPQITQPIFCAGCHNQHGTIDQWEKTEFAREGVNCSSCHMPEETGSSGKRFASHHWSVRESKTMLASAVTCTVGVEGQKAWITVENSGAGHDFPTDSKHKAVDLKYRLSDSRGEKGSWVRLARFRDPYRDDQYDLERTTIPSGEKRLFRVDLPSGKGSIEFILYYKNNPFALDEEAIVIFQEQMEFGH